MGLFDRLSPSHWWADPREPIGGPLYLGLAVVLGIVFVASAAVWILAPRLANGHRFRRRLIARLAVVALVLAAVGLLLLLFRWQLVPFFSKRLWFYLWGVAVIATTAYAVYYRRCLYPKRLAAWEDRERRRRYLPKPGHGGARSRQRGRRRR